MLARSLILTGLLLFCLSVPAHAYRDAEVSEAARAAGFADIADRVGASALPTVWTSRTTAPGALRRLGASRLGGNPDLPVGSQWPRCRRRPQTFLGQIRLPELPVDAEPLRRHDGLLLFFTHVQLEDPSFTGYGLWAGRCTRVVHAPAGSNLQRVRPPRRAPLMRLRPTSVRFRVGPDIPDTDFDLSRLAAPLADIELRARQGEAWLELRDSLSPQARSLPHRLLGYPASPNGETRCWERTQRREGAWRHLLTIGPDSRLGFEVADGGRLQVALPPQDLENGRFDRACGIFDSS